MRIARPVDLVTNMHLPSQKPWGKACYHGAEQALQCCRADGHACRFAFPLSPILDCRRRCRVVLAMVVLMSGLASGFEVEIKRTTDAVGADRWLLSSNSDGRITSVATFDAGTVQAVAQTSGVRAANGVTFLPDEVLHSGGTGVTANIMGISTGPLGKPESQNPATDCRKPVTWWSAPRRASRLVAR